MSVSIQNITLNIPADSIKIDGRPLSDFINNSLNVTTKKPLNPNAPEFIPTGSSVLATPPSVIRTQRRITPTPVKKTPSDYAEKRDLFKYICEEAELDYTDQLFEKYLAWDTKTNNRGLSRYNKMQKFIKG